MQFITEFLLFTFISRLPRAYSKRLTNAACSVSYLLNYAHKIYDRSYVDVMLVGS